MKDDGTPATPIVRQLFDVDFNAVRTRGERLPVATFGRLYPGTPVLLRDEFDPSVVAEAVIERVERGRVYFTDIRIVAATEGDVRD